VLQSWADAEWFTSRPEVEKKITVTVFKVPGETNTDDLSPAPDAWSRPDIPLHYLAMLKNTRPGAAFVPEEDGKRGPMQFIEDLKKKATWLPTWATWWAPVLPQVRHQLGALGYRRGHPVRPEQALWRRDPGRQDRSDLLQHQEDSGSLPIEVDVSKLEMGDVIDMLPYDGKIEERRHRCRVPAQVRRAVRRSARRRPYQPDHRPWLTAKAREALGLPASTLFRLPQARPIPARASRWRRRWSAAPVVCRKARACARAPTANRR
jgi:aconitate hydratase 2/2-methylisocitrate dehydratase